ncbi:hypothetical protein CPB84DRAFT_1786367 [Gymnopilus junonius]|uniref:Aminoglycoside phosphotransferase domain-containing protein n=1 Tax=Gymnopilus junonius TaxID=109634 RepID=A0A9P5NJ30_GYMJU|nr:hypothetical protein CPB84DRAFT_1786367 [Gymnopilus junonius]
MLLPYWNRLGDVSQLESYPSSGIIHTSCRAMDMNTTLDVTLDDGRSVIVRQRHRYAFDPIFETWSTTKFQSEIQLLRWLYVNSTIPVPKVLEVGSDFFIEEKMPGSTVALLWHSWSKNAKENFMSAYVDIVLELFRFSTPQRIGSVSTNAVEGSSILSVGPRIAPRASCSSPNTFDDVFELFNFLVVVKRQTVEEMKPDDQERAKQVLSAIESKALSLLRGINDPLLLQCVLTHADLHNYNILVDDHGTITAVLDWEINYIQPAILCADYPAWLSDEGPNDPDFAFRNYWWDESPTERRRLRSQFEEMVRERNPNFYKCLTEGRDLRAIVAWFSDTNEDPGFERMASWAKSRL